MRSLYLPLIIALFLPTVAFAPPGQVNLREQCRRDIAGHYLKVYDQHRRSIQEQEVVTKKRQQATAKLQEAETKLAAVTKKQQQETFNADLAAERDNWFQVVVSYRQQVENYTNLLKKSEANGRSDDVAEKAFAKEIAKVFLIETLQQKEPAGYPFQIVYRHSCSKYRRLCPLPETMAEDLRKIRVDGKLPEACRRYANYSNLN